MTADEFLWYFGNQFVIDFYGFGIQYLSSALNTYSHLELLLRDPVQP